MGAFSPPKLSSTARLFGEQALPFLGAWVCALCDRAHYIFVYIGTDFYIVGFSHFGGNMIAF